MIPPQEVGFCGTALTGVKRKTESHSPCHLQRGCHHPSSRLGCRLPLAASIAELSFSVEGDCRVYQTTPPARGLIPSRSSRGVAELRTVARGIPTRYPTGALLCRTGRILHRDKVRDEVPASENGVCVRVQFEALYISPSFPTLPTEAATKRRAVRVCVCLQRFDNAKQRTGCPAFETNTASAPLHHGSAVRVTRDWDHQQ